MASRIPISLTVGGVTYELREKPSYGHGGSSFTPTQNSAGIEVEGAEQEMVYLPRITGAQLIMKDHSLSALQAATSAGPVTVVLKIRAGGVITTFTLANTKCSTQDPVEQDGVVSLDFIGGTASGG